ncbi:MAG: right-handed parallel beta-helix repeat-containing protein [Verrucomicrobia bacterium]|nr:right-handed parallel beta-helix repeat-containing protein [Verrucomicrobiota bacterium]
MSLFSKKSLRELAIAAVVMVAPSTAQLQAKVSPPQYIRTSPGTIAQSLRNNAPPKSLTPDEQWSDCREVMLIKELPTTITKSGFYCLDQSVEISASTTEAAITVQADNVDINLGSHTLLILNGTPGISATGISNLCVHDGTIQGTTLGAFEATSNAVLLSDVENCSFKNLFMQMTNNGFLIGNCTGLDISHCAFGFINNNAIGTQAGSLCQNVRIESCQFLDSITHISFASGGENISIRNCQFDQCFGSALFIGPVKNQASNIEISGCSFDGSASMPTGIVLGNAIDSATTNVEIRNCTFAEIFNTSLLVQSSQGLLVEDCTFTTSNSQFDMIQLAQSDPSTQVTDVSVRNSAISSPQAAPGFDGIFIGAAQGVLLENCVINTNGAAIPGFSPANVHIIGGGADLTACSDIKVKNCVIGNNAAQGIYCDGTQVIFPAPPSAPFAIEIDSCIIDGALNAGVFCDNALSCTIKNCEITGTTSGPGIMVADGAQFITIENNRVKNNAAQGISIDPTSASINVVGNVVSNNAGDGIFTESDTTVIQDNTISRNSGFGINNASASTTIYDNTACNNSINSQASNCAGVPAGLIVSPGYADVVGGNICCP